MSLQLLAQRAVDAHRGLVQARDARRRVRGRRGQQVVEDPLAAQHRRRARRVGRHREDAALGQHTAPRRAGEVDLPELLPLHPGDPVMAGQPLVEERVLAIQEIEDAAVLPDHALQEQLGLPAHGEAQVVLERGETFPVGRDRLQGAELEPLPAEGLHEGTGPGVLEHPTDLRGQDGGIVEGALSGGAEQLLVGHAGPEEIREARGQLVGADLLRGPAGTIPSRCGTGSPARPGSPGGRGRSPARTARRACGCPRRAAAEAPRPSASPAAGTRDGPGRSGSPGGRHRRVCPSRARRRRPSAGCPRRPRGGGIGADQLDVPDPRLVGGDLLLDRRASYRLRAASSFSGVAFSGGRNGGGGGSGRRDGLGPP